MPNSFANDGAAGAGQTAPGSDGGDFGSSNFSGFGGAPSGTGSTSQADQFANSGGMASVMSQNGELNGFGGVYQAAPKSNAPAGSQAAHFMSSNPFGMSFDDGGAVGDDSQGSPQQDAISKALETADQVLAYGRKLHGLGGQEEDGGAIPGVQAGNMPTIPGNQSESGLPPAQPQPPAQQLAAGYGNGRMPAVPGNQSNSGSPPIQPQPGPLPPTSNPFGKRADNDPDGDGDNDQSGAIDTETA